MYVLEVDKPGQDGLTVIPVALDAWRFGRDD
jgi:hypothetical protein